MSVFSDIWKYRLEPYVKVYLCSADVTAKLVRVGDLEWNLDTPDLTVFQASTLALELDNRENEFDRANASNWFVTNGHYQHGYKAGVTVQIGFIDDTGTPTVGLAFAGFLIDIDTTTDDSKARVTAVDASLLAREEDVHNFGIARTSITLDNGDYDVLDPKFTFPVNPGTQISKESVASITINGNPATIVPSIRTEGKDLSYLNVELDHDSGYLTCELEPPGGAGATVVCNYKESYRYKRPDFFVKEMLAKLGYTVFDGIERPVPTHWDSEQFSSHGRPNWEQEDYRIVRYMLYDSTNDRMYFLQDSYLIQYDFGDDEYTWLATMPTGFVGFRLASADFSTFYILMTDDVEGDSVDGDDVRIYSWSAGGGWTLLADNTAAHPQLAYAYDLAGGVIYLAESRKSFEIATDGGTNYLYFIFADPISGGPDYAGVKRLNLSTSAISTVFQQQYDGGTYTHINYSLDFVIDQANNYVYILACYDDGTYGVVSKFTLWRTTLSGGGLTVLQTDSFVASPAPMIVSDVTLDLTNNKIYFVFQLMDWGGMNFGTGSLRQILTAGGTPSAEIRAYSHIFAAAKSGHILGAYAYYFEGSHFYSYGGVYPDDDTTDIGHLIQLDNGALTDMGRAWRSGDISDSPDPADADYDGWGLHSGCPSNMVDDGSNLHFICGYGYDAADQHYVDGQSPYTQDASPTNDIDNYIWVQWGYELAGKIPLYSPNDTKMWDEMSALAKIVNFEVGFFPYVVPPDTLPSPFFQERTAIKAELAANIAGAGAVGTITLDDAADFPTGGDLPDGVGRVLIGTEVFTYTGKTGTQLTGCTRAEDESNMAAHAIGDEVFYLHLRCYNLTRNKNLVAVTRCSPDYLHIYNVVKVNFGDGKRADVDATMVSDAASPNSEAQFGRRELLVSTSYLGSHDRPWAEVIGYDYYWNYAYMQDEVEFAVKFMPFAWLGFGALIHQEERTILTYRPLRVLRLTHDINNWQTKMLGRSVQ